MSKDIKFLITYIERHGFKLVRHNKHMIFQMGTNTLTVSCTPGDHHALHNVKRNFRRMNIVPLPH